MATNKFSIALWCMSLLWSIALMATPALASVATTQRAEGDVVAATGGANTRVLNVGSAIVQRDVVSTGAVSLVHMQFQDQSRVAMGANSVFEVIEFLGTSKGALNMGEGIFRVVTGNIVRRDPKAYSVQTPMMALGFRGTEIGISVRGGVDRIALLNGGPMEAMDFETGQTILVYAGQMVTKRSGQPPAVNYISNSLRRELQEVSFTAPRRPPPAPPTRPTPQPPVQRTPPPVVVQPEVIIPLIQLIPRIVNPPRRVIRPRPKPAPTPKPRPHYPRHRGPFYDD